MAMTKKAEIIKRHFKKNRGDSIYQEVESFLPKRRQDLLKWNGWGYNDSKFVFNAETKQFSFSGHRYSIGNKVLPGLKPWIESALGIDFETLDEQEKIEVEDVPSPVMNEEFFQKIKEKKFDFSLELQDRLFRSHGHTIREIFELRRGNLKRIPDIVIWPNCHNDVVKIVQLAVDHGVVIVPFGGGTSVSCGVECPANERRMIVSLDTTQMNKILWVNKTNNTALIEAGIIGQDLDCEAPRISSGPDIHQIILGSEGILGVITEVIMKVRPIPAYKKYGSIVFPKFDLGVECLKEVVAQQLRPASMRLMDNAQFIFGQALKPEAPSSISSLADRVAKYYLTQVKKFDMKKICVVTLLFEGNKKDVESLEKNIYHIASKYGGLPAGEENGKRGYMLTFVIAYLRDLALDFGILSESFETSVPWDNVIDLCKNVKARIEREVSRYAIPNPPLVSCRVTQSYDVGACVYFYFAFSCLGVPDAITIYEEIEMAARDEVLANGGTISHHHGFGKLRKPWMKQTVSDTGLKMLQAVNSSVDPSNIFASGNLLYAMKIQSSL